MEHINHDDTHNYDVRYQEHEDSEQSKQNGDGTEELDCIVTKRKTHSVPQTRSARTSGNGRRESQSSPGIKTPSTRSKDSQFTNTDERENTEIASKHKKKTPRKDAQPSRDTPSILDAFSPRRRKSEKRKKRDSEKKKSDSEKKKSDSEIKKSDSEIKKSDSEIKKSDSEKKKSDPEKKKSDTEKNEPAKQKKNVKSLETLTANSEYEEDQRKTKSDATLESAREKKKTRIKGIPLCLHQT